MLRIRRFGKNRRGYNARAAIDDLQNIGHVIAARATPQPVLAKVRICTRRNDRGEFVEAYYGKIYGDFEFEGDDKKGLIGVKFLYYLNPKSLDRNLEWDMKTNLCPTAGKHESQQP